jgi:hypothetical protein
VGGHNTGRSATARGAMRAVQRRAHSHEDRVGRCGWELGSTAPDGREEEAAAGSARGREKGEVK